MFYQLILHRDFSKRTQNSSINTKNKKKIMKKFILMAAMVFASVASFAQQPVGTFSIQPKVGISIAELTDNSGDARIGVLAGAEAMYQATDIFGISVGAIYQQQGIKSDNATLKLDYVNVPILANVYVVKGLEVKLGIQPGFNVNNEMKYSNSTVSGSVNVKDTELGAKSVDLSIPVGLSYEFSNVVLDARYNWGVTKAMKVYDSKNSVFQFTVGYKFTL